MDPTTTVPVIAADVRAFRWSAHGLDRPAGSRTDLADVALLDLGVQDTGPDGAAWALEIRGARPDADDLLYAWTLRGAPHAYRRSDVRAVAVATAPFSEDDAARRVFDASRPLRAAGIDVLDALREVAAHERGIVVRPTVKGDLSTALTAATSDPYQRFCRVCDATHVYEMPFRLAALQAGLELEPGTSPPVLHRVPGYRPHPYTRPGTAAEARFDVVRGYLRMFGPASAKDVAEFVDAPLKDVRAHWPEDVVQVEVTDLDLGAGRGERWALAADVDRLSGAADRARARSDRDPVVRLAGPFDPYLQLRDRTVLVQDAARAKDLWRTIGRPGAVLADGEVVGTWRPRTSGSGTRRHLTVTVDPWVPVPTALRAAVEEQADRLGVFRGLPAVAAGL